MSSAEVTGRVERTILALLGVSLIGVFAYSTSMGFETSRQIWLLEITGTMTLLLLMGALAISPLAALTRTKAPRHRRFVVALRRGLGIGAAVAGLAHAAFAWSSPFWSQLELAIYEPQLRAGAACLLILIALAATSYPRVIRRMPRGTWKPLHRAVYGAALLATIHVALSSRASTDWILGVTFTTALLLVGRGLVGRYPARP